jgi:RHS repeat-associated protein
MVKHSCCIGQTRIRVPRTRAFLVILLGLLALGTSAAGYVTACPSQAPVSSTDTQGGGNQSAPKLQICIGTAFPVNCATGNQAEEETDLVLNGRGPGLHITRTYNSQAAAEAKEAGAWGYGWSGPYGSHLEFNKESGAVTVVQENGATAAFSLEGGKYVPGAWIQATLVKEGENYIFTLPTQEKLKFNAEGKLAEQKDRNGNAITFTYESGKLTKAKDSAGRELIFGYTGSQVTSVEDPLGRKVKYAYESSNLVSVTLPGEEVARWKFKYDAAHQLAEMTNGLGGVVKTEYDENHRVKKQTDPTERVTKFEYGESGGLKTTTIIEPNGSTTFEKFNEAGEPVEVIKAKGTGLERKITNEYNEAYELVKTTDALGHSTTDEYNASGDLTLEKDAEGDETKWTYNSTHDVESETTPRGEKTTYKRDSHGNVEAIERPAPGETAQKASFNHASNGDLESVIDPLGHETKFEYDAYGDLKAETDPEGDRTTRTYNQDGEQLTETSPRGNEEGAKASEFETVTERDSQGRVIKVTDPLGHETKTAYDKDGNIGSVTDALGQTTKYTYDANDEQTKVEKATGATIEVTYDSVGEVKSRTDGNGHTTKYERDVLGQVTEVVDPLERSVKREYDAAGNLKKAEDASGRTISYSYDAANRRREINYSDENTHDVTFKYDKDGNVIEMTDGTGTTTKEYDQLDRLTEVKNGAKEAVKYSYNLGNQQTEIIYPNGKAVKRGFDKASRLEKVTDWFGYETTFSYNRDSKVKRTSFPGETTDAYTYNRADQVIEITNSKKAELRGTVTYTRGKLGQVEKDVEPGQEIPEYKYEYDSVNRLTKSNSTVLEYDKANDPTKIGSTTYTYDKADEIATASNGAFEFDKLGQRVKETPTGGTAIPYAYDQAGNLISTKSGGVENTFKYDGMGLLTSETANATTYALAWDVSPSLPLLLRSGDEYFIYGPEGSPVEQILASTSTVTSLHHDQLGSIRALTNVVGEITGAYSYGPTGEVASHVGEDSVSLGFAGQYRMHTGKQLIYMRARTYDPSTAQFLSTDPAVGVSGEPYTYASDNPANFSDPTGLATSFTLCGCCPPLTGPVSGPLVSQDGTAVSRSGTSDADAFIFVGKGALVVATSAAFAIILPEAGAVYGLGAVVFGEETALATMTDVLAKAGLEGVAEDWVDKRVHHEAWTPKGALVAARNSMLSSVLVGSIMSTFGAKSKALEFVGSNLWGRAVAHLFPK